MTVEVPAPCIINYKELKPQIDKTAYIAPGCAIIGDVQIGKNSSIWFNSVLRGDVASIIVGENTNIQDGSVIHTSRFNGPAEIGNNITIGHAVLLHACTIRDNAFIGMRAVVMDKAIIEEYGFVAAGSLVTNGKVVKSRELWAGAPARFVRTLRDAELTQMDENTAHYVRLAKSYL